MKNKLTLLTVAAGLLAGCATKTSPSNGADSLAIKQERNKAIVLACEQAFIKKDAEGSCNYFAPTFVAYGARGDKPISNVDTLIKNAKELFHAFPDWTGENLKAVASGDSVIVTATWGGTFKNDLPGLKANGKKVKFDDAEIFVLNKEGKIISQRGTQSNITMGYQLGFLETKK